MQILTLLESVKVLANYFWLIYEFSFHYSSFRFVVNLLLKFKIYDVIGVVQTWVSYISYNYWYNLSPDLIRSALRIKHDFVKRMSSSRIEYFYVFESYCMVQEKQYILLNQLFFVSLAFKYVVLRWDLYFFFLFLKPLLYIFTINFWAVNL